MNLDAVTRQGAKQNVEENACPSCFDEAQKTIYNLMEKDSYRRFLNSKLIKDLSQMQPTAFQEMKEKRNNDCAESRQTLTSGA